MLKYNVSYIQHGDFPVESSEAKRNDGETTGYAHPHTKLKKEYEHLIKRTWQLFEIGRKREYKLEEAVVNAWKYFGVIAESDDIEIIKDTAGAMRKIMAEAMNYVSDCECHFENEQSNAIVLCDKCSRLQCHNKGA